MVKWTTGRALSAPGGHVIAIDIAPVVRYITVSLKEVGTQREIGVRVGGRGYRVTLTPDPKAGGYAIRIPELPGCFSEADTIAEARRMAREAIALWLDADARRRRGSRSRTARRPGKSGADAQVAAWRKLAGKWESDVDRATEAERLMKRRTSGRKVEL